jgi:hypothetical protein
MNNTAQDLPNQPDRLSKNKETLEALTLFLNKHPELRFWQGLLAFYNKYSETNVKKIEIDGEDTFYLE